MSRELQRLKADFENFKKLVQPLLDAQMLAKIPKPENEIWVVEFLRDPDNWPMNGMTDKIGLIKAIRNYTPDWWPNHQEPVHIGLREAKEAMDTLQIRQRSGPLHLDVPYSFEYFRVLQNHLFTHFGVNMVRA